MDFLVIGSSLAFLLYILATLAIVTRLFHPKGPNLTLVLSLATAAIAIHAFNDGLLFFSQDSINFNLPNVISLVSLIITVVVTLVALRFKVNLLLPVVYGFTGLWQLVILFLPPIESIPLVVEKFVLLSHISFALIAYCILIIATLYAFQVTYINLKLKRKNLTAVAHLPPLMQVEKQLFSILTLGTVILFVSQVIGFVFLDDFLAKKNAHKTVLSLLAFATYSLILWGHFQKGWRGHRVLVLMISASGLLTLAYFGSRLVKEFIL
ncbi:cytochrome C assembly family protein [Colwellia sp. MT41]|uniref:Inner membrane protein YpjD n=1 Tax=Colwellia marinimaniae TaxID=1513592 RepID=A0ABQ0MUC9_9GAMM|nr:MULTISPECIES: cytochrome c biogenesis protein CcsA [Colwellia]ALO35686.1 cytochrome C assembly family protein [Colwellia sp. MT41]GAW95929.1 inner membrane protein YpjD [Colwellia marinimaniae]